MSAALITTPHSTLVGTLSVVMPMMPTELTALIAGYAKKNGKLFTHSEFSKLPPRDAIGKLQEKTGCQVNEHEEGRFLPATTMAIIVSGNFDAYGYETLAQFAAARHFHFVCVIEPQRSFAFEDGDEQAADEVLGKNLEAHESTMQKRAELAATRQLSDISFHKARAFAYFKYLASISSK